MVKADEVNLELLKKYFDNRCTPEEAEKVLKWIEQSTAADDLNGDFAKAWQKIKVKPGDNSRWKARLEHVQERIEMESLYDSLGVHSGREENKKNKDRPPVSIDRPYRDASRNRLRFVISLVIMTLVVGLMATFYITTNEDSVLTATVVQEKEKSTERGQKLSFHLEDGSRVQLNSNSRIIYPAHFDSLERKISLEGEAYFEVSRDNDRPFIVVTDAYQTTALGTSFNVNAFQDKKSIEVALVTGKVLVERASGSTAPEALVLNPGEMATVTKSNNEMVKAFFDFEEKIAWKDGIIVFKDADYQEIIERLEDWYGVDITSNGAPTERWEFTFTVEKNELLKNVLLALQFGHNFDFEIKGKDVQLTFRKMNYQDSS